MLLVEFSWVLYLIVAHATRSTIVLWYKKTIFSRAIFYSQHFQIISKNKCLDCTLVLEINFVCEEGLEDGMLKDYQLISKPVIDRPSRNHGCKRANPAKLTIIVSRYNDFCQSSIKTCAAGQYFQIKAIPKNCKALI